VVLLEHQEHQIRVRDEAGELWTDHDLVFSTSIGTPIEPRSLNTHWEGIRVQAGLPGVRLLSRPGARFWCCHQSVSPGRSPNPPYRSLGNGLSTVSALRRGSWSAKERGSCCPGRCNGRPSPSLFGRTRPRPP
jgi:hypothetical protein